MHFKQMFVTTVCVLFLLSYQVTDVGSWSFVGSNVPVMNDPTNKMIRSQNVIGFFEKWAPRIFAHYPMRGEIS